MNKFKFKNVEGYTIEGSYPKFGKGTFKVLMQDDNHYGELVVRSGGNIYGSALINTVSDLFEDLDVKLDMSIEENKKHALLDEEGYLNGVTLFDEKGDQLTIDADYDSMHLQHVIVGIVMTNYELDKEV